MNLPKKYADDRLILSMPLFALLVIFKPCCTNRCELLCKSFAPSCFHQKVFRWADLLSVT